MRNQWKFVGVGFSEIFCENEILRTFAKFSENSRFRENGKINFRSNPTLQSIIIYKP
jgi:hypothetical protein